MTLVPASRSISERLYMYSQKKDYRYLYMKSWTQLLLVPPTGNVAIWGSFHNCRVSRLTNQILGADIVLFHLFLFAYLLLFDNKISIFHYFTPSMILVANENKSFIFISHTCITNQMIKLLSSINWYDVKRNTVLRDLWCAWLYKSRARLYVLQMDW